MEQCVHEEVKGTAWQLIHYAWSLHFLQCSVCISHVAPGSPVNPWGGRLLGNHRLFISFFCLYLLETLTQVLNYCKWTSTWELMSLKTHFTKIQHYCGFDNHQSSEGTLCMTDWKYIIFISCCSLQSEQVKELCFFVWFTAPCRDIVILNNIFVNAIIKIVAVCHK